MLSNRIRLVLPTIVLVVLVPWLTGPPPAAAAATAEPSPTAEQVESAADIAQILAQPVSTVTLTKSNEIDGQTVGFQRTLRNGTLTVEIDWDRSAELADGVVVELYPSQWTDFRGVYDTGREASAIPRDEVDEFLVDHWNRTLCGYRDMVAHGQVTYSDGNVEVRTLGLTWQWSGSEMAIEDLAAAGNTSCPLDPDSEKCQDHAACVVTVNCGIFSFDVDGRCLPQAPFGWPCLCDPLHDLVCDAKHEEKQALH